MKSAMSNVVTVRSNKSLCMALLVLLAWYLWLVYSKNISQLHYITTVNESVLFNFNLCRALYVACLLGYMFFPSINYGAYFFGAPLLMTSLVKFQYFVFLGFYITWSGDIIWGFVFSFVDLIILGVPIYIVFILSNLDASIVRNKFFQMCSILFFGCLPLAHENALGVYADLL